MHKDPEARRAYAREYRKKNRALIAAISKRWRTRHPERAAAMNKRWIKNNPDKARAHKRKWEAANPDKVFAYKQRSRKNCAAHIRLKNRAYQQKNKAKVKGYRDKHRDKDPAKVRRLGRIYRANRRAAEAAGPGISLNLVETLMIAQRGLCVYCPADLRLGHHLDHKVPLSRGGRHEDANMQLTCAPCNLAKFTKTHAEFVAMRDNKKPAPLGTG